MATDGSKYAPVPVGVSFVPAPLASLHVAPPSVLSDTITLYAPLFAALRPRVSFQTAARWFALLGSIAICGKSWLRMFSDSTHCSGPRPKSQSAAKVSSSTPTFTGALTDERSALTRTPSCWLTSVGVLKLLNTTNTSPFPRTTGIEPWSTLHESAGICGLKESPPVHRGDLPLISIGVVQCAGDAIH